MTTMAGHCADDFPMREGWEFLQRLRDQALGLQMTGKHSRGRTHGFGGRFGPPPWAGPWAAPWGGGPGRPRAAKGDVRLAILALLSESPRHGYQLIQDIADRSHGAWSPSPGSVYPALSALQDEGLIDDEKLEGRRIFSLTPRGSQYVTEHADEIDGVFSSFSEEEGADMDDLRALLLGVGAAAMQVIAAGEAHQAQRILTRARRELFAVLASDEEEA